MGGGLQDSRGVGGGVRDCDCDCAALRLYPGSSHRKTQGSGGVGLPSGKHAGTRVLPTPDDPGGRQVPGSNVRPRGLRCSATASPWAMPPASPRSAHGHNLTLSLELGLGFHSVHPSASFQEFQGNSLRLESKG